MYMNVDFGYHPRESGTKFMICHYNNPSEGPLNEMVKVI